MCKLDLSVNVPEGRKSGKYLQNLISKDEEYKVWYMRPDCDGIPRLVVDGKMEEDVKCWSGIELKALVEGLDGRYMFGVIDDFRVLNTLCITGFEQLMEDCHSCMSDFDDMYGSIIDGIEGTELVFVWDRKELKFVGRALVSVRNACFNRVYGDKHYLLESRLLYCGFTKEQCGVCGSEYHYVLDEDLSYRVTDYYSRNLKYSLCETVEYNKFVEGYTAYGMQSFFYSDDLGRYIDYDICIPDCWVCEGSWTDTYVSDCRRFSK